METKDTSTRILICGDRNWEDRDLIHRFLSAFPISVTVIHGGARGADRMAGEIAEELGMKVLEFPAEWARYGRGAGPIRNQQMLDEGRPLFVIAFHNDIEKSKGTRDMVNRARKDKRVQSVVVLPDTDEFEKILAEREDT